MPILGKLLIVPLYYIIVDKDFSSFQQCDITKDVGVVRDFILILLWLKIQQAIVVKLTANTQAPFSEIKTSLVMPKLFTMLPPC